MRLLIRLLLVVGITALVIGGAVKIQDQASNIQSPTANPAPPQPTFTEQTTELNIKASDAEVANLVKAGVDQSAIKPGALPGFYQVDLSGSTVKPEAVEKIVSRAEPDYEVKILKSANDTHFSSQSYLDQTKLTTAWDETVGREEVVVAVVDSGVNGTHEDLSGRVLAGIDFVNDRGFSDNAKSDDNGHGTAVASIIAAKTDNSIGIAGATWYAKILPVKVVNSAGVGTVSNLAGGIVWAADNGARIINLSLGLSNYSQVLEAAVNYAISKKIVLVAAAGNDVGGAIVYPAAFDQVIAVGSVNNQDNLSYFSDVGNQLDLVAPGEGIIAASNSSNAYTTGRGTSLAAPQVAGAAALLVAKNPFITASEAQQAMRDSADKLTGMGGLAFTPQLGYGRLNASRLLSSFSARDSKITSSTPGLTLRPGDQVDLTVRFENTGGTTWYREGPNSVNLGLDNPVGRSSLLIGSGWVTPDRPARLDQPQVAPGASASFTVKMSVPSGIASGVHTESFRLVAEGIGFFGQRFDWQVTIPPAYQAEVVNQSPYLVMAKGDTKSLEVKFRNTGSSPWQNFGSNPVRLGLANPVSRTTLFDPGNWLSADRPAQMQPAIVYPGQEGTFTFTVKAPTDLESKDYYEYFNLVAENYQFFSDASQVYWKISVP